MHHMNNLYSVTPHTRERSDEIKLLLNVANLSINGFKRLNIPISTCDQWLVHFLSTKISKETHQAWECHLGSSIQIPTFAEFETFLNNHVITIDAIENRNVSTHNRNGNLDKPNTSNNYSNNSSNNYNNNTKRSSYQPHKSESKRIHTFSKNNNSNSDHCVHCGASSLHNTIRRCPIFLAKVGFERKSIAEKHKLCFNCLSKSHTSSSCTSQVNCRTCGQRHHTLLHFPTNATISHQPTMQSAQSSVVNSFQTIKSSNNNSNGTHQQ